jgi:hypothetical protein
MTTIKVQSGIGRQYEAIAYKHIASGGDGGGMANARPITLRFCR